MIDDSRTMVLRFWFGEVPALEFGALEVVALLPRLPFWGGHYAQVCCDVDRVLRERFEGDVRAAAAGRLNDWANDRAGRLALLLLLDQFPRNIYRGTRAAFAQDEQALAVALHALDQGDDSCVHAVARAFYYLPLMHAEDLALQNRAVALYQRACRDAAHLGKVIVGAEYVSSLRHRQIIARFGRFPHRNEILGRQSTVAESRFLRQLFSSF